MKIIEMMDIPVKRSERVLVINGYPIKDELIKRFFLLMATMALIMLAYNAGISNTIEIAKFTSAAANQPICKIGDGSSCFQYTPRINSEGSIIWQSITGEIYNNSWGSPIKYDIDICSSEYNKTIYNR